MYQSNISNPTVWPQCEPVLFLIPDELDICSVPIENKSISIIKAKPESWSAVQSVRQVLDMNTMTFQTPCYTLPSPHSSYFLTSSGKTRH